MHSSTSSSERLSVRLRWPWLFGIALCMLVAVVCLLEAALARRGYEGNAQDSPERWQHERGRASRLGKNALIIVGASRVQLGLDLPTLRAETGLEPVQLALDGSGFEAMLASLAADPGIRGTVLVDYYDMGVGVMGGPGAKAAKHYLAHPASHFAAPFSSMEASLTDSVRSRLAAYADGSSPFNALQFRAFDDHAGPSYTTVRADRSVLADYSLVAMPAFYYQRVGWHLGLPDRRSVPDLAVLREHIARLRPLDNGAYLAQLPRLRQTVAAIEQRGGRVVFIAMPTSGMIREIDDIRYPRAQFWDEFARGVGARVVRASDLPALKDVQCPDGSHLDRRDRVRVTKALAAQL